jgi:hypothetical protein
MTVLHPDCAAALSETTFRWPAAYIRGSQAIRSRAGWPRGEIVVLSDAGAKPRCLRVMRRTGRHEHRARAHPTRMRGARDAAREAARHGDRRACLAQSHADYPRDIPLAHAGVPTCTCGYPTCFEQSHADYPRGLNHTGLQAWARSTHGPAKGLLLERPARQVSGVGMHAHRGAERSGRSVSDQALPVHLVRPVVDIVRHPVPVPMWQR